MQHKASKLAALQQFDVGVISSELAADTAADLLVEYLARIGVEYVFGVPGGAIEPLYNALARSTRRGSVRPVVARHEAGAAFMADGYTRETGRLGVVCATTGPGATNLITGVASAYADRVPMLVITAQTALANFGRGAFQDSSCTGVDTVGMFAHCTTYNTLVSHSAQFQLKLITALATTATTSRPAHLSIPLDVLRSPLQPERFEMDIAALLSRPALCDAARVRVLFEELVSTQRVVFIIGGGCGDAADLIVHAATRLGAELVVTPRGKGLINPYHPQFRGVIGVAGHDSAYRALTHPDVTRVVAVGTDLGEWDTCGWDEAAIFNPKLIHIDADATNFGRSAIASLHVTGDLRAIFKQLVALVRNFTYTDADREVSGAAHALRLRQYPPDFMDERVEEVDSAEALLKPQHLMRVLSERLPRGTRFLADSTNAVLWGIHYLHPLNRRMMERTPRNGWFRSGLGFASMGWAIGAAVGTALGQRRRPVVCITGDGSFLMSGQEITVAVAERLPVIFVVLHDNALGTVKHGQRMAGAEPVGFELPNVDFAELARALGAQSFTIHNTAELAALDFAAICAQRGPTLLDVHIDPEEPPPLAMRIKVLGAGILSR